MRTLYDLLRVERRDSPEAIHQAYLQLKSRLAPIAASNTPEAEDARVRLVAITEAYDTLSDPIKRSAYNAKISQTSTPSVRSSYDEPSSGAAKWLIAAAVALIAGGGYWYYKNERAIAEHKHFEALKVEQAAKERELEAERARIEREGERLAQEKQNRLNDERNGRDFDYANRDQERRRAQDESSRYMQQMRDANAKRAEEWRVNAEEQRRREEAQRMQYELERQKQWLREQEMDRSRPAPVTVIGPQESTRR